MHYTFPLHEKNSYISNTQNDHRKPFNHDHQDYVINDSFSDEESQRNEIPTIKSKNSSHILTMVQIVERLPSQRFQLPLTSIILSPTLSISKLTKTNLYRNKNNKVDKFLQGCHHQHKEDKQKLYQSNNNIQYLINQAQELKNR